MQMDQRKQKVLQAIVMDYVATAEPVGSRTIARKYDLGVSPATIRNEMSDLEELGLIEQPHTSAGRVPSDQGYRYFVDVLMERVRLAEAEKRLIEEACSQRIRNLDNIIHKASRILSQMTNCVSVVSSPQFGPNSFQSIKLIHVPPNKAVVVMVTSAGLVENEIIDIPDFFADEDLQKISDVLNRSFRGKTVKEVKQAVLREIYEGLAKQKVVLNQALELMEEALGQENDEKVFLGGTTNIINQPEFKDVEKIRGLLGILEEDQKLRELLQRGRGDGTIVRIGNENRIQEIQGCSMITAAYHVDGEVVGMIGLLGPTRMDYSKAVVTVEYLAEAISHALLGKNGLKGG